MTIVNHFGENLTYAVYPSGTGVGPIWEGTIQGGDTLIHDLPSSDNYFIAFGSNDATPQPPIFSTPNTLTNNSTVTLSVNG